ncbi:hypothetical protein DRN73_00830 [Candidatus Pacearchaeota archaeon]|nr:MAG: hypothetical protein DRN73_00830 [Candidatus Pacearchaeota archaeon]
MFYEEEKQNFKKIFESISGTDFDVNQIEIKPLHELEREDILKALKITKGNRTKAAELLGITIRTLRNKLKQYQEQRFLKKTGVLKMLGKFDKVFKYSKNSFKTSFL